MIQLTEMLAKCQEENAALRLRAEQAEARCKRLEEALRVFADEADGYEPDENDGDLLLYDTTLRIKNLRNARKALEDK